MFKKRNGWGLWVVLLVASLVMSGCGHLYQKVEPLPPYFDLCIACHDAVKEVAEDPSALRFPSCELEESNGFSSAYLLWEVGEREAVYEETHKTMLFLNTYAGEKRVYDCTVWYEDDEWKGTAVRLFQ